MDINDIRPTNFLEGAIVKDLRAKVCDQIITRFPPEPNGYLHIGHAKSIILNFGLGIKFGGITNLRFDDTNPVAEDEEYVNSIQADIKWLGFDWGAEPFFTSNYFETLYGYAVELIKQGKAYVDFSSAEEIAEQKGTPTEPGKGNKYRDTSIEENLDLFTQMREGKFKNGECVLRAKIDLASSNMHLRDPLMYRVLHETHHNTGDTWCIYPMYDFAHGYSDSIEGITHSICTLEFVEHRPLYEWFLSQLDIHQSKQIEFSRLNLTYTIMSKRKLKRLVLNNIVNGWDDPRMPTISGLRRRGYTATAIRSFSDELGATKRESMIDVLKLEDHLRADLKKTSYMKMAVLDPIKLIITNYPEGQVENVTAENRNKDPEAGARELPFSRELYIERKDFQEENDGDFYRLTPGQDVRLKHAYKVRCTGFELNDDGSVKEVHCTYYDNSKSGSDESGVKVKSTIHWLNVAEAIPAEIRLYDRLFVDETPDAHDDKDFMAFINPNSLVTINNAFVEASLADAQPLDRFQFMRNDYFVVDKDSKAGQLVFNRTISVRNNW